MTKTARKIWWMIDNQLGTRNTSGFGRDALALKLKPLIEQRAQERMVAGKAAPENPVWNSTQGTGKTRDAVAQPEGVGQDTVRKVKQIIASATPEVVVQVPSGKLSIDGTATTVAPDALVEQGSSWSSSPAPAEGCQAPKPTKIAAA
ncbi:hypothetical protein Q4S45_21485 [Massilia sp. R2A-15]|uniref:hypothetical protein n=1 Tax=Massilia sp. R2A-15 TaxID=3064278 RepID=UPI002732D2EB|nr:hypothetical protein [Massilia sp. R2A-15]WLI89237.1 hypothetical protein Q4S45_21485 [Massilia sp. R2A-15]